MSIPFDAEKDLARRWVEGDPRALRAAMLAFFPLLRTIAFRFLKNAEDADEIANDTFRNANRAIATFKGEAKLSSWLCQIARNLASNRYHHRRRRLYGEGLNLDERIEGGTGTLGDFVPCSRPGPVETVHAAELLAKITIALEKIEPQHRDVIHLRYVKRMTYRAVAEALGVTLGTVKSRVARARDKLKIELDRASGGEITLQRRRV